MTLSNMYSMFTWAADLYGKVVSERKKKVYLKRNLEE
jgi:hypothetical protein